jgi:Uma2 family endonuclease
MSTALTSTFGFSPPPGVIPSGPIPPLETGDRLTRGEFRRRFEAMPDVEHAELIEGIVFMGAAVRHVQHGRPHRLLIGWLDRYIDSVPGLDGGISSSISLDNDNEPQPDGYLFLPPGMSKAVVTPEGYLEGPPELVIEISASTTSIDLNLKFQAYRRNGIREYLVWRVRDKQIDWFALQGGEYVRLPVDSEGILRSQVFPGLWLDTPALLGLRRKRLYAVLQAGQATPEFAAFAAEVARHAPSGE